MANEVLFNSYKVNPLMRNVLITNDEVLFHAPTKQTFDPRIIQQAIIIAEERYIRPELGYELYQVMVDKKNVMITDDNMAEYQGMIVNGPTLYVGSIVNSYQLMPMEYQMLWLQILWKLVAECVGLTAYPDAWIQFGAEGLLHSAPHKGVFEAGGMTSPDLASVKFAMDKKQMDRIDPLLFALKNYLCYNKSNFPLYKGCPEVSSVDRNGVVTNAPLEQKRTDFVLGLYDDTDKPRGCNYNKDSYY